MVQIAAREREGVTILDISGSMSGSASALHTDVQAALDRSTVGVVLNLEQTNYIDSTWLGAIVQSFAKLGASGRRLKLLNPPAALMQLFVITHLSEIFDIFTSEDDGVNSFFPARPLRYPHIMKEGSLPAPSAREESLGISVFLCHCSADKSPVRELHSKLLKAGAKPWLDEVDLLPGQLWEREIPAAVKRSDAILLCLSSKAVGKTGYIQREIKLAIDVAEEQSDDSIFLIPGRLELCAVPDRLRKRQWVDLFAADGYDRLLTALQARSLALGRKPILMQAAR